MEKKTVSVIEPQNKGFERGLERYEEREILIEEGPLMMPPGIIQPGFRYRFVKHSSRTPYRVAVMKAKGWSFVPESEADEISKVVGADKDGRKKITDSGVVRPLSRNDDTLGYLMRIPEELALRVDAAKKKKADAQVRGIIGKRESINGDVEVSAPQHSHSFDGNMFYNK